MAAHAPKRAAYAATLQKLAYYRLCWLQYRAKPMTGTTANVPMKYDLKDELPHKRNADIVMDVVVVVGVGTEAGPRKTPNNRLVSTTSKVDPIV